MSKKQLFHKSGKSNIQTKMSYLLILTATVILSGFGFYNYSEIKAGLIRDLEDFANFIVNQQSKSLALPIWYVDKKGLVETANSVMIEKQVYAILIRKKDGKTFYHGSMRDDRWEIIEAKNDISGNYLVKNKEIIKDDEKLGSVEVYLTYQFMYEMLNRSVKNMFITLIILNLSLGITLFIGIRKSIISPLIRVIHGLSRKTDFMFSSSGQMASISQSLAKGASDQAASVQETSSALKEITFMVRQNADSAGETNKLMNEIRQIIEKTSQFMSNLKVSIEEIIGTSKETSGIIKTIDEIAFQTNLLALNAAIEAARAGESGAGFAIVADEVRNLATRAAEAARNTSDLIEETVKKIQIGGDLAAQTHKNFGEVVNRSDKIGQLIGDIAITSEEQATQVEYISAAVMTVDEITQKNVVSAEGSATASEEIKARADEIIEFMDELKALIGMNKMIGWSEAL
jgi:methyl-accepting chemotaxis protein